MVTQAERRAGTIAAILASARREFGRRGFAATTIDDIAARGGVAKGAVYHHFKSKEAIFEQIVEAITAELAAEMPLAARGGKSMLDGIARGTLAYLTAISQPDTRLILLVDGPAVLGWNKWREIDQRHFGPLMRAPLEHALRDRMSQRQIEAVIHLLAGAVTEAAVVCAAADNPRKTARELTVAFRALLSGVVPDTPFSGARASSSSGAS